MGEAKRRKRLDPNYGKSNPLRDAYQMIDNFFSQNSPGDRECTFLLFTNQDRGCTEEEIEMLRKEIPLRYQSQNFTIWILPKKYAHLSAEEAFNHFVSVSVGMSEI